MELILASASPRRKELLNLIGLKFQVKPSNIEEIFDENLSLVSKVEKLAFQKANDISAQNNGDFLVLGADTVVVIDDKILGKPKDREDAKNMLNLLSGKTHKVITAISLIHKNQKQKTITTHESTEVKFKELTESEINNYIASGEPLDKAGAYAIQGIGVMIVEKINGCYTNVVGLPVPLLTRILAEEFDVKLL